MQSNPSKFCEDDSSDRGVFGARWMFDCKGISSTTKLLLMTRTDSDVEREGTLPRFHVDGSQALSDKKVRCRTVAGGDDVHTLYLTASSKSIF